MILALLAALDISVLAGNTYARLEGADIRGNHGSPVSVALRIAKTVDDSEVFLRGELAGQSFRCGIYPGYQIGDCVNSKALVAGFRLGLGGGVFGASLEAGFGSVTASSVTGFDRGSLADGLAPIVGAAADMRIGSVAGSSLRIELGGDLWATHPSGPLLTGRATIGLGSRF